MAGFVFLVCKSAQINHSEIDPAAVIKGRFPIISFSTSHSSFRCLSSKKGPFSHAFWRHAFYCFVFRCSPSIVSFLDACVHFSWFMIPGPHGESFSWSIEGPLKGRPLQACNRHLFHASIARSACLPPFARAAIKSFLHQDHSPLALRGCVGKKSGENRRVFSQFLISATLPPRRVAGIRAAPPSSDALFLFIHDSQPIEKRSTSPEF